MTGMFKAVMLSHRGQVGFEAKILSSSLSLSSKKCPTPRPRRFVLVLVLKDFFSASALASRICPRLTILVQRTF